MNGYEALAKFLCNKYGTSPTFAVSQITFAVGDSVKAFGCVGIVKSIGLNGFLEVQFPEAQSTTVFTIEGKLHSWNKCSSLEKV